MLPDGGAALACRPPVAPVLLCSTERRLWVRVWCVCCCCGRLFAAVPPPLSHCCWEWDEEMESRAIWSPSSPASPPFCLRAAKWRILVTARLSLCHACRVRLGSFLLVPFTGLGVAAWVWCVQGTSFDDGLPDGSVGAHHVRNSSVQLPGQRISGCEVEDRMASMAPECMCLEAHQVRYLDVPCAERAAAPVLSEEWCTCCTLALETL